MTRSKRISTLSSNNDIFGKVASLYINALKNTDYGENIGYTKNEQTIMKSKNSVLQLIYY